MSRSSRRFTILCALTVVTVGCGPASPPTARQTAVKRAESNTTAAAPHERSVTNDAAQRSAGQSSTGQSSARQSSARPSPNASPSPDSPSQIASPRVGERAKQAAPKLELIESSGDKPLRVVLRGLDAGSLNVCRKLTPTELNGAFSVYVDRAKVESENVDTAKITDREIDTAKVDREGAARDSDDLPPLLGDCRVDGGTLVFEPRYAPRPGIHLRATWDPEKIPCGGPGKVQVVFKRHAPPVVPTARVTAIYPTRDVLPENQLKFYLHFSQPMSRGEAYAKIRLLDDKGQEVDRPFLELGEELWDRSGTRFTLYFDPGRIKRGLQPRELFGPSLIEGGRYKLVVDATWQDAEGAPLVESFTKSFSVAAPDETQPDPKRWKLGAPAAATREPLTVELGESLDRALLERVLIVQTDAGVAVDGDVTVDAGETRWQFTPTQPWNAGGYRLVVETILEDLAGNSIGRPFEVNMLAEKQPAAAPETIALPFAVAGPKPATP